MLTDDLPQKPSLGFIRENNTPGFLVVSFWIMLPSWKVWKLKTFVGGNWDDHKKTKVGVCTTSQTFTCTGCSIWKLSKLKGFGTKSKHFWFHVCSAKMRLRDGSFLVNQRYLKHRWRFKFWITLILEMRIFYWKGLLKVVTLEFKFFITL